MKDPKDSAESFQEALNGRQAEKYVLRLFITGMTPNSLRAIENLKKICEEHLQGRYDLEIIDIYKKPQLAKEANIIAVPTLLKSLPQPLRRFIGDLSDEESILVGLDLVPRRTEMSDE